MVSAVTFSVVNVTASPFSPVVYTISSNSLTDVTDFVSKNGTLQLAAPSNVNNGTTPTLYASYARRSYSRAAMPSSDAPQNILQNGSFRVDHFSEEGARTTTAFLEKYVLVDGIKELMSEVGDYVWEDSVEIPSLILWTPQLEVIFQQDHKVSSHSCTSLRA